MTPKWVVKVEVTPEGNIIVPIPDGAMKLAGWKDDQEVTIIVVPSGTLILQLRHDTPL